MKKTLLVFITFFVLVQITKGNSGLIPLPVSVVFLNASQQEVLDFNMNKPIAGTISTLQTGANTLNTQTSNSTVVAYEFWFDNNYTSKVSQEITPQQTYSLNTSV